MYLHQELTDRIISCYYTVYNKLGFGFLEKVYENAMMIELRKQGISAVQQKPIHVLYDNEDVGNYFADILVENKVVLELKAGNITDSQEDFELQLTNYLKATNYELGLLLLFGKKPLVKRKIFTNDLK
jgi:GxxExxY protein